MAKSEIFSYCLFCFWNGNCWLCWDLFINNLPFFFGYYYYFLISEWREKEVPKPTPPSSDDGKWLAPICEGATFAWRLTTTRLLRTGNLFLLGERESNRGIRMCRRNSQLKIKLIFYTRKGFYTNQFLLKRWQANFNSGFLYAALNYALLLGFVIGDTFFCPKRTWADWVFSWSVGKNVFF